MFYHRILVRRNELLELGDIYQSEYKKLELLKQVRCMTSKSHSINLLEVDYPALIFVSKSKCFDSIKRPKKS